MIPFIISNYKFILIGILALALSGSIIAWKVEHAAKVKFKERSEQVTEYYANTKRDLRIVQTSAGHWEARANANVITAATLKSMAKADEELWLHEFTEIKKNMKNLESAHSTLLNAYINLKGNLRDTVYMNLDSTIVTAKTFNILNRYSENAYTNISGIVDCNKDSISATIDISAPIKGIVYWERIDRYGIKWFMGKKKYESLLRSENPDVKIIAHESIQVKKK